jgi:hypothetical protein
VAWDVIISTNGGCDDPRVPVEGETDFGPGLTFETPQPPTFNVSAVQAHFAAECMAPGVVHDSFCQEVRVQAMRGEGDTLYVPTTLNGQGYDRAVAICDQFADWQSDPEGNDLGYASIAVVKRHGGPRFANGQTATCEIRN